MTNDMNNNCNKVDEIEKRMYGNVKELAKEDAKIVEKGEDGGIAYHRNETDVHLQREEASTPHPTTNADEIEYVSDDQIFGDNNQVARIPVDKVNAENAEKDEDTARRTRDIMREADDTRSRLNRKSNEVRDYGADARETPIS